MPYVAVKICVSYNGGHRLRVFDERTLRGYLYLRQRN